MKIATENLNPNADLGRIETGLMPHAKASLHCLSSFSATNRHEPAGGKEAGARHASTCVSPYFSQSYWYTFSFWKQTEHSELHSSESRWGMRVVIVRAEVWGMFLSNG